MKPKHRLLIICAAVMLLSVLFVLIGCSENGTTENKVEYGDWITVSAPSCDNAGLEMRTALTDPNITETRTIPATGHDWNAWETVSEPTCLLEGVETRTCNICDNSDMRAIPALGHDWDEWETVLDPDCESCGTEVRVCLRDNKHTEYREIPMLGHDYGDWVLTLAPTCTSGGAETRYCRNDNRHTELRSVAPYGHNWGAKVTTVHATCTEQGEQMQVCVNDSTHVRTSIVNALGHDYGDWGISVPATEIEDGVDIRVCRHDSSHTETRVSPALGSLEGLSYSLNKNGTEYYVFRDNYNPPTGTIYIPAEHNGLPVTELRSFGGCDIERVVFLGNNLKRVSTSTFVRCNKLQSIEFPEGVEFIGFLAFSQCKNLKSISLPSTVVDMCKYRDTLWSLTFACPALETITVAEGNTAYKVDNGCLIETATGTLLAATRNAVIPEYTTTIVRYVFARSQLESISIPASVSNIGFLAFEYLTADQTIIVKGFASQEEADNAWRGPGWRNSCNAAIIYEG